MYLLTRICDGNVNVLIMLPTFYVLDGFVSWQYYIVILNELSALKKN